MRRFAILILVLGMGCSRGPSPTAPVSRPNFDAISARIDPYSDRNRIIVLTDIANEPDDQMSMVRFLVYSNGFDVEGLIAGTSTWMRNTVRPDVIGTLIDAYATVKPSLDRHAQGYPDAAALRRVVASGQTSFGMAAVGPDKMTAGAETILRAADRDDPRPLWITVWGGANTLAQALLHARAMRTPAEVDKLIGKLRVYSISDQDDAGPWIRREFPGLFYIAMPSTPDGDQYAMATWTGISGDEFYRNSPGADFTTFTKTWVDANIRSKGPLGKLYPYPCCIHEGDTPSYLGLISNGLASAMSPTFGGWGGRYVWRQFYGESHPSWTQGGDAFPGRDSSRDTVLGIDGKLYTSDQASIWRWRTAFQHDFAARMDWTVRDVKQANHNPMVVLNGRGGKAPLVLDAQVGVPIELDASSTTDPDGDGLSFRWFYYPEAGTGIPTQPVFAGGPGPVGGGGTPGEGGIPSVPAGLQQPPPRVVIDNADRPRAVVTPKVAGTAHVILVVEDRGTPSLTSYRRVVVHTTSK
jgi:Cellulose-binding Sde182, nucleoside hydrolase-like domain/Cellulose-binding protein Sde0182, C-terminal domain